MKIDEILKKATAAQGDSQRGVFESLVAHYRMMPDLMEVPVEIAVMKLSDVFWNPLRDSMIDVTAAEKGNGESI